MSAEELYKNQIKKKSKAGKASFVYICMQTRLMVNTMENDWSHQCVKTADNCNISYSELRCYLSTYELDTSGYKNPTFLIGGACPAAENGYLDAHIHAPELAIQCVQRLF